MKRKTVVRIGAVALCGWGALALALDQWGQRDRAANNADVIVVLGARVVPPGVAGLGLRARAIHAAQLFHEGKAPRLVCTGGIGNTPPAESIAAAKVLENNDVPRAAIFVETVSTSTWENAEETAKICRARGWKRVIVVSAPYHVWRASRNFRRFGLETSASPSANVTLGRRSFMALREAILVVRDAALLRL
ncbi:MAG TPA: YdcF family protein [Abditibacteriaceae bacterium]|jgi:uncharacterized SAM-binding protein YcdF (DUF218 family)